MIEALSDRVAAPNVSARVLVVDDSLSARRKLALAVGALGHEAIEASGGVEALERLQREPFDLVLLDVLMPEVDGLEVLRFLQHHERLRDVPVLVVSGLENQPGTVSDAIRLGALDFLPKSFEPVLLNARVGAALRRKRDRDRQLIERAEIDRLTAAAALLEHSLVDGPHLALHDLATRTDPLGRFAATFERLAVGLHARERTQRRRLAMRRGLALLLVSGVLFGLTAPLSKIAATQTPHAMGLSLWVNALSATVCLGLTAWRRRWPRLDPPLIRFVLLWGTIGSALADVLLFQAARTVPASTLSIIIVLNTLLVFALAAISGHERASFKRLAGLLFGLAGVAVVLDTGSGQRFGGVQIGLLIALSVPLCYAFEDLLVAHRLPRDADLVALVGLTSLVAVLVLVPFVWYFDQGVSPSSISETARIAIVVMACSTLVGTVLHSRLIVTAGAVFGSQASYVIALSGIVWAMLLLGERPAAALWAALALLLVGLLLVEPKREPDAVLGMGVFGIVPRRD